ncbi:MAG: glycosyltransferase family 2 protein [Rhodobacteraceae bacterium]|nr:glycosyltransferase family 2 protein [Paracoccaceae bacterium]
MVRNERDIIDVWVAHLLALFDRIIIIDHLSTDGTREELHRIAERHPSLDVRHYNEPPHAQGRLMTELLQEVSAMHRSGWMFFIDADEFLMVPSRAGLDTTLAEHHRAQTVRSTWAEVYPVDPGVTTHAATRLRGWHSQPSVNCKVAVNLSHVTPDVQISFGNHNAWFPRRSFPGNVDALHLLHLPIRSAPQFLSKVIQRHATIEHAFAGWDFGSLDALDEESTQLMDDLRRRVYNYGCQDRGKISTVPPPPETIDAPLGELVPLHPIEPPRRPSPVRRA